MLGIQPIWLEHLHRQGKSPHTRRAYAQGLKHFAHWYEVIYGAAFAPDQVMPRDVRDYATLGWRPVNSSWMAIPYLARERNLQAAEGWLMHIKERKLPGVVSLSVGLRGDRELARAARQLSHNNGQVESQLN